MREEVDEKVRYTRYNYKKKKNNDILRFILSFIGMSVFVIIVGVLLANVIIHFLPLNNASTADANNKSKQVQTDNSEIVSNEGSEGNADTPVNAEVENNNQSSEVSQETINTSFMAIQCGYFAQEDNAKEAFNKIIIIFRFSPAFHKPIIASTSDHSVILQTSFCEV